MYIYSTSRLCGIISIVTCQIVKVAANMLQIKYILNKKNSHCMVTLKHAQTLLKFVT